MAISFSLMAQPAGRLYPKIGPRRMVIAGLTISVVNTLLFVFVDLGTNEWLIRGLMLMRGMGMCLTFIPLQTAAFSTITPENTGRASAVFNANFQVSGAFMVALLAMLLTGRLDAHNAVLGDRATDAGVVEAFRDVFVAATVLAAVWPLPSSFRTRMRRQAWKARSLKTSDRRRPWRELRRPSRIRSVYRLREASASWTRSAEITPRQGDLVQSRRAYDSLTGGMGSSTSTVASPRK